MSDVAARLMRYVGVKSVSRDEAALADLVAGELAALGLAVQRRGNNVWTAFGDAPRPRLLLNSHLDTVPPGRGWSAAPWAPRVEAGCIIGLGANDAKGCVAAIIAAAAELKEALRRREPLGGTLIVALTAEEEISGEGLGTIRADLEPIDAAIVGEPTGLVPMIAQRGLLILRCVAGGIASHPANTPTNSGTNAIFTAAEDILRLRDMDWGPAHPLLGACHAHVTQVNGGIARNVVPDACEFFIDVRTTPMELHDALIARVRGVIRSTLHVHSSRLAPIETSADAAIVRAVLSAVPGGRPAGSPAMSDMVFLAGIPSVKLGPGQSPRSHTADEFILESELTAGVGAYTRIVREYFRLAAREE